MSSHPELNQYIEDVLKSLKPVMENKEVEQICLVIFNHRELPIERFTFEIAPPTGQKLR